MDGQERSNILEKALEKIQSSLPQLVGVYLFGSFGTEYQSVESDLDLAILSKEKLDDLLLWDLAQQTAVMIQRDVEIVDLAKASTVFRFQVFMEGERIACQDHLYCDHFENASLSMYLWLNEERKGIIEDRMHG
ncbi:nucleotidyltransferase domain-containing protein [Simkania negevensis]|uniref:Nucleotidyltransferase domain-containing protein n=1 Tax=Simkania negevensis TaxID=83561 RepID=A0ABS3ARR2_9BACT|nr:nucleotidyltransferase domain-containing protein [Simkania negevensis]